MSEILSRDQIAKMADQAAQNYTRTGRMPANPFAPGTDAAKAFGAAFERYYLLYTAPSDADLDNGA